MVDKNLAVTRIEIVKLIMCVPVAFCHMKLVRPLRAADVALHKISPINNHLFSAGPSYVQRSSLLRFPSASEGALPAVLPSPALWPCTSSHGCSTPREMHPYSPSPCTFSMQRSGPSSSRSRTSAASYGLLTPPTYLS